MMGFENIQSSQSVIYFSDGGVEETARHTQGSAKHPCKRWLGVWPCKSKGTGTLASNQARNKTWEQGAGVEGRSL